MICLDFICLELLTLLFETIFEFFFLPQPLSAVGILGMSCQDWFSFTSFSLVLR